MALSATGGSQYLWSPANGLSATSGPSVQANPTSTITYTVTALNEGGTCFDTASVTVTINDLELAPLVSDATCIPNGSVTVGVTGGSGSYQYDWAGYPAVTGNTINSVGPGILSVQVTDNVTGCSDSAEVYVAQIPGSLSSFVSASQEVSCFGASDGVATVAVTGNTQALSYAWSPNVGSGPSVSGLAAGTYSLTVTEAVTGCETTTSVTIPSPPEVDLTVLAQSAPTCNTYATATVNASGGTGPYSYTWNTSPAQIGASATGLEAQTYKVYVVDQDGCEDSLDVVVAGPTSPIAVALVSSTDATACNTLDGAITVSGTGSGGNLNYAWQTTPAQFGPTANNLAPGSYTVLVTGTNGCDASMGVTIGPSCILSATAWDLGLMQENQRFVLSWNVDPEQELQSLTLERSLAGENFDYFRSLGLYATSGTEYDSDILPGATYLYRLRGEDGENRVYLSNVVEGLLSSVGGLHVIRAYPIPAQEEMTVELWSDSPQPVVCTLYNTHGQLISSFSREIFPGKNNLNVKLESVSSGYYQLEIKALGENGFRIPLIKR
ncbi:MAG: hypothetical protein NWR72_09030 [Bacteroidia bacterium]|nr:hypothetical protein [Bacteroidia bacterium]